MTVRLTSGGQLQTGPATLSAGLRYTTHRIRERQIKARTALVNQSRGLLAEYGLVRPKGVAQVRHQLPFILEDAENGLTLMAQEWLHALAAELQTLEQRIQETDTQTQRVFASHGSMPTAGAAGGGRPLDRDPLVAAVGEATTFK